MQEQQHYNAYQVKLEKVASAAASLDGTETEDDHSPPPASSAANTARSLLLDNAAPQQHGAGAAAAGQEGAPLVPLQLGPRPVPTLPHHHHAAVPGGAAAVLAGVVEVMLPFQATVTCQRLDVKQPKPEEIYYVCNGNDFCKIADLPQAPIEEAIMVKYCHHLARLTNRTVIVFVLGKHCDAQGQYLFRPFAGVRLSDVASAFFPSAPAFRANEFSFQLNPWTMEKCKSMLEMLLAKRCPLFPLPWNLFPLTRSISHSTANAVVPSQVVDYDLLDASMAAVETTRCEIDPQVFRRSSGLYYVDSYTNGKVKIYRIPNMLPISVYEFDAHWLFRATCPANVSRPVEMHLKVSRAAPFDDAVQRRLHADLVDETFKNWEAVNNFAQGGFPFKIFRVKRVFDARLRQFLSMHSIALSSGDASPSVAKRGRIGNGAAFL